MHGLKMRILHVPLIVDGVILGIKKRYEGSSRDPNVSQASFAGTSVTGGTSGQDAGASAGPSAAERETDSRTPEIPKT